MWAEWERKFGVPLPKAFRDLMEKDYLDTFGGKEGLADLEGGLEDFFRKVIQLEYFPSPQTPKRPPQERYKGPFNRRLHMVDFIIGRQLTIKMCTQRSFSSRKRINWEQTCEAWNEAHPYDPRTSAVLKATFYRAITEETLQQEYFIGKDHEYAAQFAELLSCLVKENTQAFARFGEALERFGQLVTTMFERVGQFALNHKDDIENLVLLADKLNSMPDSEREKYIKLFKAKFENKKGSVDGVNY